MSKTPTKEEIKRVQEFLNEQNDSKTDFLNTEDVNAIIDYMKSASAVVSRLAQCISSNKIVTDIETLIESESLRKKELLKIINKNLYGEK